MKQLFLISLIGLTSLIGLIGSALPVLALELQPKRDEPPALERGQAVESQLLVKFTSAPTIAYESEIAIPIPFTGRRITLRKEGLAIRGLPGATAVTKGLRIQSMKVLGDGGVANQVALAQLPEGVDAEDAAREYRSQRGVDAAEPNYLFESLWTPNDNYMTRSATQDYQWNFYSIRMPEAWDVSPRGGVPAVKVAVIDSGVAFEGNGVFTVASELDHIPFVSPRRFESLQSDCSTPLDSPIVDNHPNDLNGHGTHVTGTIAQKTNNWMSEASNGLSAGMAHNVSIIPIKALTRCTTGPKAGTSLGALSDIIAGVGYATLVGADVINMSLGGPSDSTLLHLAITTAVNAGVTVVASSGNDALRTSSPPIGFPAAYPEVIAVGATRFDGKRAEYSQYGPELDLVAPGGQLWADDSPEVEQCLGSQPTIPGKVACLILDQNNDKLPDGIVQQTILPDIPNQFTGIPVSPNLISQFRCVEVDTQQGAVWISDECGNFNGTSMSSPHVAAAAALILSVNPNLTPAQVKDILTATASKTAIPGYTQAEHGAGLLDVAAALAAAGGGPTVTPSPTVTPGGPTLTPSPTTTPTQPTSQTITVRLSAAQEVPPTDSTATGTGTVTINRTTNTLTYQLSYTSLSSAEIAAHIHGPAARGSTAGPVHTLPTGTPKSGEWTYPEELEQALLSGEMYINIHSQNFPDGEIRGQIDPWTITEPFQLLVGDVNDTNSITVEDVSAVLSKYTDFKITVSDGTPEDVNADGFVTIEDVALVLLNYNDFSIPGEAP